MQKEQNNSKKVSAPETRTIWNSDGTDGPVLICPPSESELAAKLPAHCVPSAPSEAVRGMSIGDVVRYSGHAIKPKRDYWLSCGRSEQKSAAKDALDKFCAQRGEVTSVNQNWIEVRWFDGSCSKMMPYIVEPTGQTIKEVA